MKIFLRTNNCYRQSACCDFWEVSNYAIFELHQIDMQIKCKIITTLSRPSPVTGTAPSLPQYIHISNTYIHNLNEVKSSIAQNALSEVQEASGKIPTLCCCHCHRLGTTTVCVASIRIYKNNCSNL